MGDMTRIAPVLMMSAMAVAFARPSPGANPAASPRAEALLVGNIDATNDPMPQVNPTIAINPRNENELFGTVTDYRSAPNKDSNCGYMHSVDGGQTWAAGIIPGMTTGLGGDYDAAENGGGLYLADGPGIFAALCRGFDRDLGRSAILFSTTSDGGATWSTPVSMVKSETADDVQGAGVVGVDVNPSSPTFGRLSATWTRSFDRGGDSSIYASCSDDGGMTWTEPVLLSGTEPAAEGPTIAQGQRFVYVYYTVNTPSPGLGTPGASHAGSSVAAYSVLLGEGCLPTPPELAFEFAGLPDFLPGNGFRVNDHVRVARTPIEGHVNWYAGTYSGPVTRSAVDADVLLVRSTDGGATWSEPIQVSSRPFDDQFFPSIGVSRSGAIWVCYYDQSWNRSNFLDLSCSRSTDGGLSFQPAKRVSTQSSDPTDVGLGDWIGDFTNVTVTRTGFSRAIWMDTRTGDAEAFTLTPIG